jgi:hypothetical protein
VNWIRELKVGDCFLDESRKFKGVVTEVTKSSFSWKWYRVDNGDEFANYAEKFYDFDDERLANAGWIRITPLLKALL